MQRSGKFRVTRRAKRSGSFRALGFFLSVLLALASLSDQVLAHSAYLNDGYSATDHHDVGSNDTGDDDTLAFGHCISVSSCLSCLPAPEQVLQTLASSATVEFTRILVHLGPTLEQELPPPRLSSQV